jgi:hypothetical protein
MRRGIVCIISLVVLLMPFLVCYDRGGAQEAVMTLANKEVFKELQRPPVKFTHEDHMNVYPNCTECHHVYQIKDGKKVNTWSGEEQKCSECHKLDDTGKTLSLMNAYHQNCTGCHRDLSKEGKKTGPAACGECHVQKH